MNWKIMIVGGIVMYLVMFVVSFATGPLIHEGYLDDEYRANESFWRPELNQDPPDMVSLMPLWISTGIVTSLIIAGIYGYLRPALGTGWRAGLKYGVLLSLVGACYMAGWSGLFNLPYKIWIVWALELPLYYLPGGAVLGIVAEKLSPAN